MAASLIQHGAIRTTEAKAKELRRFAEKLVTLARKGTLHARRQAIARLGGDRALFDDEGERLDQSLVEKLFGEIGPRYADRPGGYTRIIRLAERRIGDAGVQVLLQLVEEASAQPSEGAADSGRRRRAAKRRQAAADAAGEQDDGEKAVEDELADSAEAQPEAAEEPVDSDGGDEKDRDSA